MTFDELQQQIAGHSLDAYILTRGNMFLGQDVLDEENQILSLTGFSGSAGTLIICPQKAYLLVDGRYELQAGQQVDTNKIKVVCRPGESLSQFIQKNFPEGSKIGYNPWCHPISEVDYWKRTLKSLSFIETPEIGNRKMLTETPCEIFEHEARYAGQSMEEKLADFKAFINQNELDAYFIAAADCVSWLMNLRSNALPDTPVLRAFALIGKEGDISLFTNDFNQLEVELSRYQGRTIGVSFNNTPRQIYSLMKAHKIWLENIANPIVNWKAAKNPVEIEGIKKAHQRDGAALCRFLSWLEKNGSTQDELSIAAKIKEFRKGQPLYFSNSFDTIAGIGANGAIIHYHPEKETNKRLKEGKLLLLDSGAQYLDGTTDVTRTVAFGKPTAEMIENATYVLKAHIALAQANFPEGTSGQALDAVARVELWKHGLDYGQGTGHGVGCFSNVHEGPIGISTRYSSAPLQENMILSDEPGYYKEGAYGIRIENLLRTVKKENGMLGFEVLTLAPLDKKLINKYLLNKEEESWINAYHQRVEKEISPLVDKQTQDWLKGACSPL